MRGTQMDREAEEHYWGVVRLTQLNHRARLASRRRRATGKQR
jgi:hypothetical protein